MQLKKPEDCTPEELADFENLVRVGFRGSNNTLPQRIRVAKLLAFYRATGEKPSAIAAIKKPAGQLRNEIFEKANAAVDPNAYELELGWVYVDPAHRRQHVAIGLCRRLLSGIFSSRVFATTRSNNTAMLNILHQLDFRREGRAFPGRDEELLLFLRSVSIDKRGGPAA